MRSFELVEWFHIKDRGWVATSYSDRNSDRMVFDRQLIGTEVLIDGHVYKVRAVEQFRPGTPISVGEGIGLLVEGEPSGKES